jgi:hypothetical protein
MTVQGDVICNSIVSFFIFHVMMMENEYTVTLMRTKQKGYQIGLE